MGEQQIIELTQRLLDCVGVWDWATYEELCDERLKCFEPEAPGQLVEGLAFHKYYFDTFGATKGNKRQHVSHPVVTFYGEDVAVIAYVRLQQNGGDTQQSMETRVWHKKVSWKCVHFHRSSY